MASIPLTGPWLTQDPEEWNIQLEPSKRCLRCKELRKFLSEIRSQEYVDGDYQPTRKIIKQKEEMREWLYR